MASDVSTIQSLKAVDAWIDVINANINGGVRTAFKSSRVSFDGSNANVQQLGNLASLPLQFPEPALQVASTRIELTSGAIVSSTEDTHMAINGAGFFGLLDRNGEVLLTRDGDFHYNDFGLLVNNDGLPVIDRTIAATLPATAWSFNPPGPTVAEINTNTTQWQRAVGGANAWFPYVPGTIYDEGGTSYQNQTIVAKRTYVFGSVTGTEQLTVRSDNAGYLMINGKVLGAADVVAGPYPSTYSTDTVYNIGPYLRPGANTIAMQVTEGNGGEFFYMNGVVDGQTIQSGPDWATTVIPLTGAAPSAATVKKVFSSVVDDMVVIAGPADGQNLEFTKYGSTVWKWLAKPTMAAVQLPGAAGAGTIVNKALESSNSSMTQSVPELSLAQKLFSALTKVLQTKQTNVDGVLNLVR